MDRAEMNLYWRIGRPQALREISGTCTAEALESGAEVTVTVDHTPGAPEDPLSEADFAFAEPPRFTEVADLVVLPCCDGTTGTAFKVLVRAGDAWGGGGYGPLDVELSWTRRGVLNGPE